MDYPVANIFSADFLTWLRHEWLELEQNKVTYFTSNRQLILSKWVPAFRRVLVIDWTYRTNSEGFDSPTASKWRENSVRMRGKIFCLFPTSIFMCDPQAVYSACLRENLKCGITNLLHSQLKGFKWSGMPIRYLEALFMVCVNPK